MSDNDLQNEPQYDLTDSEASELVGASFAEAVDQVKAEYSEARQKELHESYRQELQRLRGQPEAQQFLKIKYHQAGMDQGVDWSNQKNAEYLRQALLETNAEV